MTVTKTDIKYIVPFILFVGLGLWGSFYFSFREDKRALTIAFKWCLLPSLVFGILYAYYAGYKRAPVQAKWRKILAVVGLTIFTSLIFLRSFEGYIFLFNGFVGKQRDVLVSGFISRVDKPKKKKLLNFYTIYVKDSAANEFILDVPGTNWEEGELFDRRLRRGSLGLIYGN